MTLPRVALAALLGIAFCAAAREKHPPVFACNAKAIPAEERPRHSELTRQLMRSVRDRREHSDGYSFQLDSETIRFGQLAEWITRERLCCPFLTFQLTASGDRPGWMLKLTGPRGVKQLLQAEFGSQNTR
jgi:hypothetical protein